MTIQQLAPKQCFDLREANPAIVHLDVRTPSEFAGGHPEGSLNVPILLPGPGGLQPNPAFRAVVARLCSPEQRIVLSCAMGGRSQRAAELLEAEGFQRLVNMTGGFSGRRGPGGDLLDPGWRDAGLPVSVEPGPGAWAALQEGA